MNKFLDIYLVYQFLKKLSTPFNKWKAYDYGIIDKKGNILRPREELSKEEQKDWTYFDVLILNIRKLILQLPAGNQKIANIVMALHLTKEFKNKKAFQSEPGLARTKGQIIGYAKMKEQFELAELLEKIVINEDGVPVNSAGGGNIAGIGVGSQGEPGVKLAMIRRYQSKNIAGAKKYGTDVKSITAANPGESSR